MPRTDRRAGRPDDAARVADDGFAHVGPVGTGHFVKMVHNGVEYALMEAYAEGYELLTAVDLDIDVPASMEVWRHGSVVRSWLLDLLADGLRHGVTCRARRVRPRAPWS